MTARMNIRHLRRRAGSGALLLAIACAVGAGRATHAFGEGWLDIGLAGLCVTEGEVEPTTGNRLSVDVPKMRAYVSEWTAQSIAIRFTYLGGIDHRSPLGSGETRLQFGLKLRAQDACNLVYAMWRIEPQSELVVSVKRNPDEHTSTECGNRGYEDIKPTKDVAVPKLKPGASHTLRADLKDQDLRVYVDDREVWRGIVGQDAAALKGPVGIRSDNVHLEFDLKATPYQGIHPDYVMACKAGAANSD
jgi:hypothetical protein